MHKILSLLHIVLDKISYMEPFSSLVFYSRYLKNRYILWNLLAKFGSFYIPFNIANRDDRIGLDLQIVYYNFRDRIERIV